MMTEPPVVLDARILVGLAASGLALVYYLSLPGRTFASAAQDATRTVAGLLGFGGTVLLTANQKAAAAVVDREFTAAGYGWLVVAATANAYAESRLDATAIGDNGHSVGLFQLHDAGAGAGMSTVVRMDATLNTRRILDVVKGPQGNAIRARRGLATHAELAALFAQHIERCAACGYAGGTSELDRRRQLVVDLYGADVAAVIP